MSATAIWFVGGVFWYVLGVLELRKARRAYRDAAGMYSMASEKAREATRRTREDIALLQEWGEIHRADRQ